MKSYNDNLYASRNPHQDENLDGPKPLKSSWNLVDKELQAPPEIAPKIVYFIDDEDGNTVGKCEDKAAVYRFLTTPEFKCLRLIVRPERFDEESLQTHISETRQKRRWESGFGA